MDSNTRKILQNIVQTAQGAAEEAKFAMASAGKAVAEKYDYAKASLEQAQLRGEQEKLFADIGKELYHLNTGMLLEAPGAETTTPQQRIDELLLAAEQKQQAIDMLAARMKDLARTHHCPACGHACDDSDVYCSVCGAKLEG